MLPTTFIFGKCRRSLRSDGGDFETMVGRFSRESAGETKHEWVGLRLQPMAMRRLETTSDFRRDSETKWLTLVAVSVDRWQHGCCFMAEYFTSLKILRVSLQICLRLV